MINIDFINDLIENFLSFPFLSNSSKLTILKLIIDGDGGKI